MLFLAGESRLPLGVDIWFDGKRCQAATVYEADDKTGSLTRIVRLPNGDIVWKDGDLIYEKVTGNVEFRRVSPSDACQQSQ